MISKKRIASTIFTVLIAIIAVPLISLAIVIVDTRNSRTTRANMAIKQSCLGIYDLADDATVTTIASQGFGYTWIVERASEKFEKHKMSTRTISRMRAEVGWPMRCFGRTVNRVYVAGEEQPLVWEESPQALQEGLDLSNFLAFSHNPNRRVILPCDPMPLGVIANFVSYCAIILFVRRCVHSLIRLWRRRCGRCSECGYPLLSDICSECGNRR